MAETVLNQQEPKIDPVVDTRRQNNVLRRIIRIILSVILIGLTAYVFDSTASKCQILSQSTDLALNANDPCRI